MTEFITPTLDLLGQVDKEAGEVLPPRAGYRTATEFYPDWNYIASAHATVTTVVAALTFSYHGVPEWAWDRVIPVHCPRAAALLAAHNTTAHAAVTGAAPALVMEEFARAVNEELAGYAVLAVIDTAAMMATVIGELGAVPRFEDPR